jgi:hypothetical protein
MSKQYLLLSRWKARIFVLLDKVQNLMIDSILLLDAQNLLEECSQILCYEVLCHLGEFLKVYLFVSELLRRYDISE